MPIVTVQLVLDADGTPPAADAAARLADALDAVLGAGPGRTWVRLETLPRERYAESGGGPPHDVRPVFVEVLLAERPRRDALRELAARLADATGRVLGRPRENVHVVYPPDARGRVAFGGRLLE